MEGKLALAVLTEKRSALIRATDFARSFPPLRLDLGHIDAVHCLSVGYEYAWDSERAEDMTPYEFRVEGGIGLRLVEHRIKGVDLPCVLVNCGLQSSSGY